MTIAEQVSSLRRALHRPLARQLGSRTETPIAQLTVLKVLQRVEIRRQSELADLLLVEAPTVSRMLDRLEQDGCVVRHPGEDRRCVRLEVTPRGLEELALLDGALSSVDAELERAMAPGELTELRRLLQKATLALSPRPAAG